MTEEAVPFRERTENLSLFENADEALGLIAQRLENVRAEFGPTDFPEDNGVAFRNEFWKFPTAFLASELRDPEEETDKTFFANFARLRLCTPHQLMYLTGVLHLKGLAYLFIASRPKDPMYWRSEHFQWLGKRSDWVANTYDLGSEGNPFTVPWFEACKLPWDEAHQRTESLLYSEVARTIGVDPQDETNKGAWSGMAFLCIRGHEFDDDEWGRYCRDVFG